MAQLPSFKRLIVEDFDEKDRALISKVAYSVNDFAENIISAFSNNITIADNLAIVLKTLTVTVNANGIVTGNNSLLTGLQNPCQGTIVIKAQNISNSSHTPTGTPFITFRENSGLITLQSITNLTPSEQYKLTLILF